MKTIYLTYIAAFIGMLIFYTMKYINRKHATKFDLIFWIKDNAASMVLSVLSTIGLMMMFNFEVITTKWDFIADNYKILQVLNAPVVFGLMAGYYGTVLFKFILKNVFANVTNSKSNERK